MNKFRDPDHVLSLPYVLSLSHKWDLGKFKHFWQELKYLSYKEVEEVWAFWGVFFFSPLFFLEYAECLMGLGSWPVSSCKSHWV